MIFIKKVKTRFDNSNNDLSRPFPKEKNNKVFCVMKDELGGKIIKKFLGLGAKIVP